MNSSMCVFETPKKKFISTKPPVTPPVISNVDRFSPSRSILNLMDNARRIHEYEFHIEVNFTDLSEMSFLTRKLVKTLSDYFMIEAPDVPDIIIKLEILAVESENFGPFLKYYVAEEFSVPSEYSFCLVSVLNYMEFFKISVDDALCDIFQVYSREPLKQ